MRGRSGATGVKHGVGPGQVSAGTYRDESKLKAPGQRWFIDGGVISVTATTQLADDFAVFPVTLDVSLEPGAVPFVAKLSYAVDDLARGAPAAARFEVPAGYSEATSLMGVIFPQRRGGGTSPVQPPSTRPTTSP